MARKTRPATYGISPELVEVRDAQAERESQIKRAVRPPATLDPQLKDEVAETLKREEALKGRSVSEAPITR